ncbi:hypothetical protein [Micromonospora siamensis]|uniref:Secreted protein n=1 Tax=Micromonospora siamensis TaxID=299152 RepID=A0A1C5HI25_9ACTN|nr:hypothetical protein [Micromonospora siamensis]SCG45640.1 hypothetical protein GA0074704_1768 [Micromonospora siamensis]
MRRTGRIAMVAVLVAAALAGPGNPAQAADPAPTKISASGYTLTTTRSYADADLLGGAIGADRKRGVDWILANANRSLEPLSCQTGSGKAMTYLASQGTGEYGFCWDETGTSTDDPSTTTWIPQGITTTADAYGNHTYDGVQAVATTWYSTDAGHVRVSLAPAAGYSSGAKYRHLLLVDPTSGGNFTAVEDCHAGGAMWYGTMLYVACTDHVKLFSWDHLWSADTTSYCADKVGRFDDNGTVRFCASGYAYVMAQVGQITPVNANVRFSSLALDRGSSPDKMVVTEYSTSNGAKIWRYNLDYTTRLPAVTAPSTTTGASDVWSMPWDKVQGAVTHGDNFWFHSSGGSDFYGKLRYWNSSTGNPVKTFTGAHGAEAISYWGWGDGAGGQPDMLYTLSEHPGYRAVIAIRQGDFN